MTTANISTVNLDTVYSVDTQNANVSMVNMDILYQPSTTQNANVSMVNMDVAYVITYEQFQGISTEALYVPTPNVQFQGITTEVLLKFVTGRRRPVYVAASS